MTKNENHCMTCVLPCIYESCPYYNVEVHYCDMCGNAAYYCIDNEDFCEECAEKMLKNYFNDEPISEQAKLLGFSFEKF